MSEKVYYDRLEEPIVISKPVTDLILRQDHPSDLMALYQFYYYTAKWQGTNQPKATVYYVAEGLKWTPERVRRAKARLIRLGLVADVREVDEKTKRVTGYYIKVKFLWKSQPSDFPEAGKSQTLGNREANAFLLLGKGKKEGVDKFDPREVPPAFKERDEVINAWSEFCEHRRQLGCPITPIAWRRFAKLLNGHTEDEIIEAIDKAVTCGWRGLFFKDRVDNVWRAKAEAPAQSVWLNRLGSAAAVDDFLCKHGVQRKVPDVDNLVLAMKDYYDSRPCPGTRGPTTLMSWDGKAPPHFLPGYIRFLEGKQAHWPVRSIRDIAVDSTRWREYIQTCELETGYNWATGRRLE